MADIVVASGEWPPWRTALQYRAKTRETAEEHLWWEDILYRLASNHRGKHSGAACREELTDSWNAFTRGGCSPPPPFPLVKQSHGFPLSAQVIIYTQEQEGWAPPSSSLCGCNPNMQFIEKHSNEKKTSWASTSFIELEFPAEVSDYVALNYTRVLEQADCLTSV